MAPGGDDERLSFLGRRLPSQFECRVITLQPGQQHRYDPAEWHGAIAVVEDGEIELETVRGRRCSRFMAGDVLCLMGVPVRALHATSHEPAVLAVVRRRPRQPAPKPR